MLIMENAEEVMQILERFTKLKQKDIPKELEDYLSYVAKTGDTVYTWANIKYLFREKLMHVIKDFHDSTSSVDDLPQYPNVDPFNYETMKSALLERLELFSSAPFTVQRLCELLTDPKKQYCRIDKYMRALEKNILVVSTIEPGRKQTESENGDSLDSVVNGELSLDVNIDVEIDMASEAFFSMQQLRNSATSSNNNINITGKPSDDDDIEMPNAKKQKLDEQITVTTLTTEDVTVAATATNIPNTPTSDIPKKNKNTECNEGQDCDSQECKEEKITEENKIDKIVEIEQAKTQTNNVYSEKLESKIISAIEENKIDKVSSTITDSDESEKLGPEKNETKDDRKLTEESTITSAEEDKLLKDDDTDCTKTEIDIKLNLNKPTEIDEAVKDADELIKNTDVETTLKESAEADENVEKEIEKIEIEEADTQVDFNEKLNKSSDILRDETPNDSTSNELESLANPVEKILSKLNNEITDDIKLHENMTVEDTSLVQINVVEPIVTAPEIDVTVPSPINSLNVPGSISTLEIEIQPVTNISNVVQLEAQIDQPMEDSIVDNAMVCPSNDTESVIGSVSIDEVVMQTVETEMATDVEVPTKLNDKPDSSGMDVDDTSQEEAMDQ